ncbi:hypothetical protein LJR290_005245 [Variovorax sp. LjRoot290]|uniref:hypothetical protein n=1 Tax=Variovorax sp. LjRoot290 TaxID=3342316 RepID=UPI003ED0FF6A
MARQLLSIALTVDQHDDGDFYWMLLESFDNSMEFESFDNSMEFESLMESASGFETYIEALDAGYLMLKRLSDDLAIGPQDEFDDPGDPANSVNRP